jgi:hypothetical protein
MFFIGVYQGEYERQQLVDTCSKKTHQPPLTPSALCFIKPLALIMLCHVLKKITQIKSPIYLTNQSLKI